MKYASSGRALCALQPSLQAQQPSGRSTASRPQIERAATAGPRYTAGGELIRPSDFREWMFVTSGLGMTYNQPTGAARTPNFTNVYVNPSSYRAFMKTGQWPDKTMFILEIRASTSEGLDQ